MSDDDGRKISESVGAAVVTAYDLVAGTRTKRRRLGIAGVVIGVGVIIALFAATAFVVSGGLAAAVFVVGIVVGAGLPVAVLWGLRDLSPGIVGTTVAILAQLTYGQSAIVRDQYGGYHWRLLREEGGRRFVELPDGTTVDVAAEEADLYRFGLGELAVTEAKTNANMRPYLATDGGVRDKSTRENRAGYEIHHPEEQSPDSWVLSLKHIQALTAHTGDPDIVRRAREKALEEAGGTQQVSGLVTMLLATGLLVGGFVLGYGALML